MINIDGGDALVFIDYGYKIALLIAGIVVLFGYLFLIGFNQARRYYLQKKESSYKKIEIGIIGSVPLFFIFVIVAYSISEYSNYMKALQVQYPLKTLWIRYFPSLAEPVDPYLYLGQSFLFFSLIILFINYIALKNHNQMKTKMEGYSSREKTRIRWDVTWQDLKVFLLSFLFITSVYFSLLAAGKGPFMYYFLFGTFLLFFIALPISIVHWGYVLGLFFDSGTSVEVITSKGKETLVLIQTTESDYRFLDNEGNEIIIPKEKIDRIIFTKEKDKENDGE